MRQEVFDFAPPQCRVDQSIRDKLESAAIAIGKGAFISIVDERLRYPVIVRSKSIAIRTSTVELLQHVADYLSKGQRVRLALEDWARRETKRVAKRNADRIGTDTTIDWRPDEAVPEDFYAY